MASIIKVEHLSYVYNPGMPNAVTALDDVSFEVEEGDFVGIIGATGSGKSTLITHMNGLNKPTSGKIYIDGRDLWEDPAKIREIQRELIEVYENDFSKHNGKVNSGRILMVFRSIVSQLAKPNEKFIYGAVREGARARDFEEAIEWLVSAGMLNRIYNVGKMEHPLTAFDKLDQFKLFLFDTGLLKYMAGIDNSAILLKTDYQFKGPLTENYVLQQLRGQFEVEPRYYADKNSEIDFVLQYGTEIIPVEAKSGEDKSAPSFKRYIAQNQPKYALRFSRRGYRKDGAITNLPLYLARKTKELL